MRCRREGGLLIPRSIGGMTMHLLYAPVGGHAALSASTTTRTSG